MRRVIIFPGIYTIHGSLTCSRKLKGYKNIKNGGAELGVCRQPLTYESWMVDGLHASDICCYTCQSEWMSLYVMCILFSSPIELPSSLGLSTNWHQLPSFNTGLVCACLLENLTGKTQRDKVIEWSAYAIHDPAVSTKYCSYDDVLFPWRQETCCMWFLKTRTQA